MAKSYWLMKSEPEVYSIHNLAKDKHTWWEGVRNYQARNFMIQDMKVGDLVLFYHSNADVIGISGIASVSKAAEVDATQFDKKSDFFDPKSTKENPRWKCVQIKHEKSFSEVLPLELLKKTKGLEKMQLLRRGQRLSVQVVTEKEFQIICEMAK